MARTRFLLVHGAWHGAWCWREIVPLLASKGHEIVAIDLPGHGENRARPEEVTLRDYVDRIVEAVHAKDGNPILVGHSMGGVFSQAAEAIPDRLRALVYIAGLLPTSGSAMLQCVNPDPELQAALLWAPDRRAARISPAGAKKFLFSECPPKVLEWALPLLRATPAEPFAAPVRLTEENFGRVPKYYVECLRDKMVPLARQRAMRANFSFRGVYSLNTDHSPIFSAPEALAAILHRIAEGGAAEDTPIPTGSPIPEHG
jgi:pimeloyl-ACP methyl ester carboxylesterase